MKKRLLAGVLVCLTVCLLAGTALGADPAPPTSGAAGPNLSWTLSSGTLTISGTGSMDSFSNADTVPWAASRTQIRSVTIPSGVTDIGQYAFFGCTNLTSVTLPSTVTRIEPYAFSGCTRLGGTLNLPSRLLQVGQSAFSGCTSLAGVTFPRGIHTIDQGAFSGCSKLSSASLPNGLTTIGNSAFSGTNLSSVQIPTTVTSIGEYAFRDSKLTDAYVPASVSSIGTGIFDDCTGMRIVHFGGDPALWEKYDDTGTISLHYTNTISDVMNDFCDRQNTHVLEAQCPTCGKRFHQEEVIETAPHTWSAEYPMVPATCRAEGKQAYKECTKCGLISGGAPIPALTHVLDTTADTIITPATCTTDGSTLTVHRCTQPDASTSTGRCPYYEIEKTEKIEATGHTKPTTDIQEEVTKEPTCSTVGSKKVTFVCKACKKKVTATEEIAIDPKNHDNQETKEETTLKPTCTVEGTKIVTVTCKDCNLVLSTKNDQIPALGHLKPTKSDEIYVEVTKKPTCVDVGQRQYIYQCQRLDCDGPDTNRRIVETEDIPALGHMEERVEAVPATCIKPGVLAGTKCSVCKKILSGCVETKIDPDAHPEDKLESAETIDQPPTCTVAGSKTVTVTCADCTKVVSTETVEIPPSHDLDETQTQTDVKVAATCTTPGTGILQHKCKLCDQWIDIEEIEIPALGRDHEFGEWIIDTDPTPTTPGLKHRECIICGYTEPAIIPPEYPARTITLDPNGGTLPDGTTNPMTTGTDGKLTAALPTPTRTGFVFDGWFTEQTGGAKVTADTVFNTDATLYAQWSEEKIFTITLDANGGILSGSASVSTGPDARLTALPAAPAREGFTFDGWYTAAAGGSQITAATVFQENTTIYAHWTEKQGYTITLDADGGTLSGSASVSTGADGRLSALPGAPTREGYDFDGWFTAKEGGVAVTTGTTFDSDSTIYAHWSVIDNTTAFAIRIGNVTGGVISASASTATRGTKVTVLADPDSGYALDSVRVTASGTTVEVTRESEVKYSFTMPGKAVDVTASFKSTGSGSGSGSGSGNNNNSSNNSGGAVWDTGTTTADPNPQPVPVKQSVPQLSAYGPQTFLDIPTNHWAAGEIAWAFQQGYMNGTGGGSFSPQAPITHSQLWTVLTRLLRYSNLSESNLLAIRAGLLDGGNPNGPATRQELVTALHRCAYLLGGARTPSVSINTYGDSSQVAGYARDAMAWAVTNGIISGTADGRLNPNGAVSRAQFAVILYRFTCRM